MKRTLTASLVQEGGWYVAQCLEVDVASQGETPEEALANLREALELHFEAPVATIVPDVRTLEVEVGAAWAASLPGCRAEARSGFQVRLQFPPPYCNSHRSA